MGKLTKNISREELACHCGCGFDSMDFETLIAVQECCDYFARVMGVSKVVCRIHSAARCLAYNRSDAVKSNDRSQHPKARAIDFNINGVSNADVYQYLDKKYKSSCGIGSYATFTHFDTRSDGPKRW